MTMTTLLADPTLVLAEPPVDFLVDTDVPIDPLDLETLPPVDIDECGPCRGTGEVYAGYDEHETGAPVTDRCPDCFGTGSGL